jgi:hypothetical protein
MHASFSRLILFRPRPEFPLPLEWESQPWIPLGDLRPLLQAVSPVRDLSDIWRWVAAPLPLAEVEAALAPLSGLTVMRGDPGPEIEDPREKRLVTVRATLVVAEPERTVERVELAAASGLLGALSEEAVSVSLEAASVLQRACGCLAVGIG